MVSFTISELNYRDAREVKQAALVYSRGFSEEPTNLNLTPARAEYELHHLLQPFSGSTERKVFVAKNEKGEVIGIAAGKLRNPDRVFEKKHLGGDNHYFMHGLTVHPDYRRRGIASALNQARLQHCKELGCKVAYSFTTAENAARQRQFAKEGFEKFHESRVFEHHAAKNLLVYHYLKRLA